MMTGSSAAVLFGLLAAMSWGGGDFLAGFSSRKLNLWFVLLVSQLAGLALVILSALVASEPFPGTRDLFFGGLSGFVGVIGLLSLYGGLARYPMGLIAPLSALLTAVVPVVIGISKEGLPDPSVQAGLLLGAPAIYLVANAPRGDHSGIRLDWKLLRYPLFAGLGFGVFFVTLDQVSVGHVFWPIVAVRIVSILVILIVITWRSRNREMQFNQAISTSMLALVILGGVFDAGGNVFFALATQAGRLDISAVLSSLFPGATVLLAWIFLKEKINRLQIAGVIAALAAVVLISI